MQTLSLDRLAADLQMDLSRIDALVEAIRDAGDQPELLDSAPSAAAAGRMVQLAECIAIVAGMASGRAEQVEIAAMGRKGNA